VASFAERSYRVVDYGQCALAHVSTEHFVHSDLRMSSHRIWTRVLHIQRQYNSPSAIEQVVTFHLQPSPENYDSSIFGAANLRRDGTFYRAEDAG
jgi:hypothetical protein